MSNIQFCIFARSILLDQIITINYLFYFLLMLHYTIKKLKINTNLVPEHKPQITTKQINPQQNSPITFLKIIKLSQFNKTCREQPSISNNHNQNKQSFAEVKTQQKTVRNLKTRKTNYRTNTRYQPQIALNQIKDSPISRFHKYQSKNENNTSRFNLETTNNNEQKYKNIATQKRQQFSEFVTQNDDLRNDYIRTNTIHKKINISNKYKKQKMKCQKKSLFIQHESIMNKQIGSYIRTSSIQIKPLTAISKKKRSPNNLFDINNYKIKGDTIINPYSKIMPLTPSNKKVPQLTIQRRSSLGTSITNGADNYFSRFKFNMHKKITDFKLQGWEKDEILLIQQTQYDGFGISPTIDFF